jgi:hypothetical protein
MSDSTDKTTNYLEMSDDDFAALPNEDALPVSAEPEVKTEAEPEDPVIEPTAEKTEVVEPVAADTPTAELETPTDRVAPTDSDELPDDFDYKTAYLNIRKPFKAGGQTIVVKNDDEIISLMQKGIGFTAKSQKLAQQAKLAAVLEKGQIGMDDLPFLIDLQQKKPDAIRKLIKEAGIDPLDIDTDSPDTYTAGNYSVTDKELAFTAALDELTSTPEGKEFVGKIHTDWDSNSKEVLWENTSIMAIMAEQYQSGVYKTITDEMSRQKLVGTLSTDLPFIQAYKQVGDQLLNSKAKTLEPEVATVDVGNTGANVVAKRVVTPKPNVANDAKARAANVAAQPKHSQPIQKNPLAMSDEDFMKLAQPS